MKLTIKNIIRWEQLTGKSFGDFNVADREDIAALMYVTTPIISEKQYSFDVFKDTVDCGPQLITANIEALNRYLAYIGQFSAHEKEEKKEVDPMALADDNGKESTRISDLAMNLIYSGIDAHYVMEEAEICDLYMLGKGAEEKMHRTLENDRLWSFMGCLPYIDSSKIKDTSDFYPFPWEEKGKPTIVTDEDMKMAEAILCGKEVKNG